MLLKMVILVKRENLIKATQPYEYIVSLSSKTRWRFLLLCCFFELPKTLHRERVHIFCPKKYIDFSNIRNCMLKRDMEFRPFYLFVRQFVCNLKIILRNSVITPFRILNISVAACRIFWWWIETEPLNKSITAPPYQWAQWNCDLKNFIH